VTEAIDLMWNKAGIIEQQSNKLLFEYQPYVEHKINKIEKIWETDHKIAVNTILRTLVYISHLDCGSVNPVLYAKRWRVNGKGVNLSGEIWDSIYPVFESKNDENILNHLTGLINGLIFISVPDNNSCSSDIIQHELERLTKTKEVIYNLDYIRLLHSDLLDLDYNDYKQHGRPKMELIELKTKHGFDLTLNVVMIGLWLILHDCGYIPYHHNHVDDTFQGLRHVASTNVNWSSYRGEIYHIASVFFSTKSDNDTVHNGSNFVGLFGIGYNQFLERMEEERIDDLSINNLVIWYTLLNLYRCKHIR
jgi:hypothetical protein